MTFFDLTTKTLRGADAPLAAYEGQVLLVVNVASECGFTPQYEGLERLHEAYKHRGFSVLGFPCNQFGEQEPGEANEIEQFCTTKFGVRFPLCEKVDVKGIHQSPVYAFLAQEHGEPKWNFHKYLVSREGRVIAAYPSKVEPESAELREALEAALA